MKEVCMFGIKVFSIIVFCFMGLHFWGEGGGWSMYLAVCLLFAFF